LENCSTCIRAKHRRVYSRIPITRADKPFSLIHSDLVGPFPSSNRGSTYFIVFIDDCTRICTTYSLKTKTAEEIITKFCAFHADIKAGGYAIQRFRSDNGTGEFNNALFLTHLAENGIHWDPSPRHMQDKNGVAERVNQTLMAKARAMLTDAELPVLFWAAAIQTATYLHQRTPTESLPVFITPYEALTGSPPVIKNLRRFGCLVWKFVPKELRAHKFSERSKPCIFLGVKRRSTRGGGEVEFEMID
jgi:transposase InsO family protein